MKLDNTDRDGNKLVWHCLSNHQQENCSDECLLRSAFDLFGKKHSLTIIRLLLLNEKMRFNKLEKEIRGSPKTITQRLRDLESKGLVKRQVFNNEIPVRVEYSLTDAGEGLDKVFAMISEWVKSWVSP